MRRSTMSMTLALAAMPAVALAQAGPALQAGEIIQNSATEQMKVLGCRPTAHAWRECETVVWQDGRPASNPAWWNEDDLIKGDARVRSVANLPPRRGGVAVASACPRTPYGGPVAGATPASQALFQRKIADLYTFEARPPYWYGVSFERFDVGAPVRNVVTVTAAGATRVNEGAPVDAVMYPVASTYVVCEQSPGQAARTRIVNHHYCFVGREAQWVCAGGGGPPPQMTRLD